MLATARTGVWVLSPFTSTSKPGVIRVRKTKDATPWWGEGHSSVDERDWSSEDPPRTAHDSTQTLVHPGTLAVPRLEISLFVGLGALDSEPSYLREIVLESSAEGPTFSNQSRTLSTVLLSLRYVMCYT